MTISRIKGPDGHELTEEQVGRMVGWMQKLERLLAKKRNLDSVRKYMYPCMFLLFYQMDAFY